MSGVEQQTATISGAITAAPAGEIDRNVAQPRQPSNLSGLLRFAMEATKVEDAPHDSKFGPLDEERKKFLDDALKSMTVDVIEVLYKNIQLLQNADQLKQSDDITEYLDAFESILNHIDMMDIAMDFHKIGGFTIFHPCFSCIHSQIRASACNLLAELCQNNLYCQKVVMESDFMEILLNLLEEDPDEQVQIKALYAISCNIRDNPDTTELFLRQNGLKIIVEVLQRPNEKLKTKSAFLLISLVGHSTDIRDKLIKTHSFIPILINLFAQKRSSAHEHIISLLWVLVLDNPKALQICAKQEYGLEHILRNHLKFSLNQPEMADEHEHCELLLQAIISTHPDPFEADR